MPTSTVAVLGLTSTTSLTTTLESTLPLITVILYVRVALPALPFTMVLDSPAHIVEFFFFVTGAGTASVTVLVETSTRSSRTFVSAVSTVSAAGETMSSLSATRFSSDRSSATVLAVVVTTCLSPATRTSMAFGVLTEIWAPSRGSGTFRSKELQA